MGGRDFAETAQPVGQAARLGGGSAHTGYGRGGGTVRVGNERHTTGAAELRKSAVRCVPTPGVGTAAAPQLGGRAPGTRGGGSCQASSADRKGNAGPVGERTSTRREVGGSSVLEDGVKVGRGTEADFPTVHLDRDGRGDHRLGGDTEASSGGPVCSLKMGGDPGRSGGGDRSVGGGALSVRTTDGCHIGKAGGSVAGRPGHEGLHGALGEARGGRRPDAGARGRKVDVNVPGITSSQAHRRRGRGVVHNPPVCVEPGEYCQGIGDLACDEAAVRIGTQHSLVRRGKRTRLPSTREEKASPLHVSGVPVMDVAGLRRRLDVEPRRRFDEVWKMTFSPEVGKAGRSSGRSAFSEEHAGELASFGIARKATGPGEANNVPFTVLEEKPEGLRQRFILWTKDANWLEERYTAQVPLHHISRYLDQVREECGSTRDFRTGFYAIEIPEEARSFFRFQTEGGSWFELCRLPMGHVCAPGIMHTLAAAAAGDPAYVLPEWRVRGVRVDVFIDNIRYTGEAGMVLAATANLDAAAGDFCLTWKPADSFTAETKYTFLGVDFDHRESEVKVSTKICRKLQGVDMDNVTAGQLESMGGRLMHASAVAGETPGKHWFALKFPQTRKPANPQTRKPATRKPANPQNPQTRKPANPQTRKPANPQTRKPANPQTRKPANPQTRKPANPQTRKPANPQTRKPANPQTRKPANPQTRKPANPQTRKPANPQTRKPANPQTRKPANPQTPQTRKPANPQTRKPANPQTRKPANPQTRKPHLYREQLKWHSDITALI